MDTYEKAYKDALQKAKKLYEQGTITESLSYVFPELKEPEGEKIRKALIRFHKSSINIDGIKGEDILAWLEKQGEKKTKWTEEEESNVEDVIYFLDTAKVHYASTKALDDCIDWLKSLKNKVLPKQEWSDEDEELLQHCCGAVAAADYYTLEDKEEMENWLKSIKQRML